MAKKTGVLKEEFRSGAHRELLRDIYLDENVLDYQTERYIKALESYEELYGEQEVEIYSAPGRSEVGGNHTDHQHGKVLAASINLDIIAVVSPREDGMIEVKSDGYPKTVVDLSSLEPVKKEVGTSTALIRGVAARIREMGYAIGGFQAYATSDVLSGSGMSSSAAYEVVIGTILSGLYNDMKLDAVDIAKIGQYAENVYFGKPCGLMDQTACSVGGLIHIDFADPDNTYVKKLDVDFEAYDHCLCITDTKGSHADLTDEYASIPADMKKAAAYFGKEVLRQVDEKEFFGKLAELREKLGDRPVLRALHFFGEEKRVDEEIAALERGDFDAFKKWVKASGASSFQYLQNVFTVRDLNGQGLSVGLAVSDAVLGERGVSRVHGGGFAGTIQAFVPGDAVQEYREALDSVFGEGSCHVLKVRKYGGMIVL